MTINLNMPKILNKTQPVCISTAIIGVLTGCILATSTANAAPEIVISQPTTGSTTVVEQYSDGKTATITATPNSITMQDGLPFAVTQISNVPRYTIHQGTTQGSTTITTVPVNTIPLNTIPVTNQVTRAGVLTTPVNTVAQVLPVATNVSLPVINQTATNQVISSQPMTSQIVSATTSLDTLQLQPTFSTPDIVGAQTKIMKILKNSDGRELAVPANHVAPGDVIEYHTTYTNTTAQPVNDINAMVSLPTGVKLVSLNSPLPTLATTGGDSYQTIQQVGNTVVIKENYSGLKWNLVNLDANTPQTVVIRAKVQ
ncbi:hypothetical protein [Psychrobacter sp. P11G5]|uniref:hypothetical protein n=1 Tax=Psychrobacter sp. P11G5 TaxID=1699624 RepID=UPI00078CBC6A|nr:hypothetical protein [Psychrobacter sp. P11G5]AMN67049.1 hypothetical protein AK825_04430 [Psychrobacter sp. P11G5]